MLDLTIHHTNFRHFHTFPHISKNIIYPQFGRKPKQTSRYHNRTQLTIGSPQSLESFKEPLSGSQIRPTLWKDICVLVQPHKIDFSIRCFLSKKTTQAFISDYILSMFCVQSTGKESYHKVFCTQLLKMTHTSHNNYFPMTCHRKLNTRKISSNGANSSPSKLEQTEPVNMITQKVTWNSNSGQRKDKQKVYTLPPRL